MFGKIVMEDGINALGRFIISEPRDSIISSPVSSAVTEMGKSAVGFYANWR